LKRNAIKKIQNKINISKKNREKFNIKKLKSNDGDEIETKFN